MIKMLTLTRGAALEFPAVVICSPPTPNGASVALDAAFDVVRMCSDFVDPSQPMFSGPRELDDVTLPNGWDGDGRESGGRRVTVDRRYDPDTGSLLVKIPDPTMSNQPGRVTLMSTGKSSDAEPPGQPLHPGAAHAVRCSGAIHVIKEFTKQWGIGMKRRVVVVHAICRLPRQCHGSLRRICETSHFSTLLVMTCSYPYAIDPGWMGRAVFVRVGFYTPPPSPPPPPAAAVGPGGGGKKRKDVAVAPENLGERAHTDAMMARIRSRGGLTLFSVPVARRDVPS
jgi:hypothetical protein